MKEVPHFIKLEYSNPFMHREYIEKLHKEAFDSLMIPTSLLGFQ